MTCGEMDTLAQRMIDLRQRGWDAQLTTSNDGVRCELCGAVARPEDVAVDEVHRFEGESDPADESILVAITMPEGHRGTLVTIYGPEMSAEEADAISRLPPVAG